MMPRLSKYLNTSVSIAPLAGFRILFGFIMLVSIVRFMLRGWIKALYIEPEFYFTFYGFEWIAPLGASGMYLLFAIMAVSAIMIMLGYRYRLAALLFFLSFTYVELIDKTNYLNHYYFVSIISFLLIFLPANGSYSLDAWLNPKIAVSRVPRWTITIIKLQLAIVYLYAGAAKLNPDWLFEAMPLKIWLPANAHLPLIGPLLEQPLTAYFFSWAGAAYDLTIVFFLINRITRPWAYLAVVVFHLSTALLFQIGMFPYIMILATLIFFPAEFHQRWLEKAIPAFNQVSKVRRYKHQTSWIIGSVLVLHFSIQLLLPLRSHLYPGDLFWTEEGYRFSWRVMLMEKAGYAIFHVKDPVSDREWEVQNWRYLTKNQEKMMATQPDMILQFAHYLEQVYQKQGYQDLEIRAECYVTLNGKRSRLLVDPDLDLTQVKDGFDHKDWVLPSNRNLSYNQPKP